VGPSARRIRILSLDGGGFGDLSKLLILNYLMKRVQREENLSTVPYPCDYFDLICGSSMGGFIALMLGRLRMVN